MYKTKKQIYKRKKRIALSILFTCMFSVNYKIHSSTRSNSHQNAVATSASIADRHDSNEEKANREKAIYCALRNIYPGIGKNPDNDETRHELNAAWEEFRGKIPAKAHSSIKKYVAASNSYDSDYENFKKYMDRFLLLEEFRALSLANLNYSIYNSASHETKWILEQIRSFCKNRKERISKYLSFFKDGYKYEKEGFKDVVTAFKNFFSIEDPIMKCSISDFHIDNSDHKKSIIEQIEQYKFIAERIHEFVNSIDLDPIFDALISSKSYMDYFHKNYNSILGIHPDFNIPDSKVAICERYCNALQNFRDRIALKACSRCML